MIKIKEHTLNRKYIISIDMGGTKILAALINSEEGIVKRLKKPTIKTGGPDDYVRSLSEAVHDIVKEYGLKKDQVAAVCLGVPGSVNPFTGVIAMAPNLGLKNFNVKKSWKS